MFVRLRITSLGWQLPFSIEIVSYVFIFRVQPPCITERISLRFSTINASAITIFHHSIALIHMVPVFFREAHFSIPKHAHFRDSIHFWHSVPGGLFNKPILSLFFPCSLERVWMTLNGQNLYSCVFFILSDAAQRRQSIRTRRHGILLVFGSYFTGV